MSVEVPAPIEERLRKEVSRRIRLKGYGLFAAYVIGFVAILALTKSSFWIFLMWTGGYALATRHLRASRVIEERGPKGALDKETRQMVELYESEITRAGQREVVAGSLSVQQPATDGELSLADRGAGDVSIVDRER